MFYTFLYTHIKVSREQVVLLKSSDTEKLNRQGHRSMISTMHCYLEASVPPKIFSEPSLLLVRACKTQA